MKRSIILAALFAFGLLGCNRPAGSSDEPRFITSPGTFELFGGHMTVSVEETQDGLIDYSVTRGTSTAKTDPLIRKGSDWLIYAASPDAVWMHDGETNVLLIELSDKGDSKFTSIGAVPNLLQRAPPAFVDRLPPGMKN